MNHFFITYDKRITGTAYVELIMHLESSPNFADVIGSGYCLATRLSADNLRDELVAIVGQQMSVVVIPISASGWAHSGRVNDLTGWLDADDHLSASR